MLNKKKANILPEKFIIILDGWSIGSTHYVGIFAQFFDKQSNESVTPLLAISPLQDEKKLSASSHYELRDDDEDLKINELHRSLRKINLSQKCFKEKTTLTCRISELSSMN